jgi:RNA polymerase sigma factor (sigma-70 family)
MHGALPTPLSSLLTASDSQSRDDAWAEFLSSYSALIMRVARLLGGDDDAIMNRYAFALDALRRDDFKRLRQYTADGRGKFTTWLVLVVRRLCLDEHRSRYGRRQSDVDSSADRRAERRRLVDLLGVVPELAEVAAPENDEADASIRVTERSAALESAVARLDVSDRLLVRLRFQDELSVPHIARIVRAPSVGHVYRRLDRVLASLRAMLRQAGVEDSVP